MVLDKGTLDVLFCQDGDPALVTSIIRESHRVLRDGGVFFSVTHAPPCDRLVYVLASPIQYPYTRACALQASMTSAASWASVTPVRIACMSNFAPNTRIPVHEKERRVTSQPIPCTLR